jgi:hypothetical protein
MSQVQTHDTPPKERSSIINQVSQDSTRGHCFIYDMLHGQSKYSGCVRSCSSGCEGQGWCELRQIAYDSQVRGRTMAQSYLIKLAKYLESEIEGEDITDRLPDFWNEENGGSARFKEAWKKGVHLPNDLMPLCVTPSLHGPQLGESQNQKALAA